MQSSVAVMPRWPRRIMVWLAAWYDEEADRAHLAEADRIIARTEDSTKKANRLSKPAVMRESFRRADARLGRR